MGLRPCPGLTRAWEKVADRPDEGTFVATVSNINIFIQEPSPALSGTLSHPASLSLRSTGEGECCKLLAT